MHKIFDPTADHYVITVDGEEMIRLNGSIWDGKYSFSLAIENERDARLITLDVYRSKWRSYVRQAIHSRGPF